MKQEAWSFRIKVSRKRIEVRQGRLKSSKARPVALVCR